jgi:prolyl 4-hydroxylase
LKIIISLLKNCLFLLDQNSNDYRRSSGSSQRQYTIFVYLNDVANGGETNFPKLNVSFKPKKGSAVFWENCVTATECHEETYHQGKPPIGETKYGLNIWSQFPAR